MKKKTKVRVVIEITVDTKDWSAGCDESFFRLDVAHKLEELAEIKKVEIESFGFVI